MKTTGTWLVLASIGFWLSWWLMPGVGVTDTATIFALVGAHRSSVYASVILQLLSAAAYAPAIVGLLVADAGRGPRALRLGCGLLAAGAMGSAADAIFHLVAFEMTAPGIGLGEMGVVMRKLQGPDLVLILPFVLAFFAGHGAVVWAHRRHDAVARSAAWLLASLPAIAVVGALARGAGVVDGRVVGLAVLGALSGSLALVGISLARGGSAASMRSLRA
jgi:hypothetical protein